MPDSFMEVAKSVSAMVFDGFTDASSGFRVVSTATEAVDAGAAAMAVELRLKRGAAMAQRRWVGAEVFEP